MLFSPLSVSFATAKEHHAEAACGGEAYMEQTASGLIMVAARFRHIAGTKWGALTCLDMRKLNLTVSEKDVVTSYGFIIEIM